MTGTVLAVNIRSDAIHDAAGGSAQVVQVNLENTPGVIRAEVTKLGDLFGTRPAADAYLAKFDAEYARISSGVTSKLGENRPTVASHLFMAYWEQFAGLAVVGTFGPMPFPAARLAELTATESGVAFGNAHPQVVARDRRCGRRNGCPARYLPRRQSRIARHP